MNNSRFIKNFTIPNGTKIVSFDIFDTLLLRPFERPEDIFRFITPTVENVIGKKIKFTKLRKKAEKNLRKNSPDKGEITIDEIYQNFSEIPVAFRDQIKTLEIEAEFKFCFPRKSGQILYETAKKGGFKVIAVSDIYFEKSLLKELLHKNGFDFDEVFSSATLRKRKADGSIFPEVCKKMEVMPNEILHIGDNQNSDINKAKEAGLKVFHLPLLRAELHANLLYKKILKRVGKYCILSSITASMICKKLDEESEPRDSKSLFSNTLYNLGFNAFGQMIFAYTIWLYKNLQKHNIKKVFFVARDGYIMQKVFDILFKESDIKSEYLECSRRSILPLSINSVEAVIAHFKVKAKSFISVRDFIENKLECDPEKIIPFLHNTSFSSLDEGIKKIGNSRKKVHKNLEIIIKFYAEEIFERMQKERENIFKYIEKSKVLEGKVALCDIGYTGKLQLALGKMGNKNNIFGFYFLTHKFAKAVQNAEGFLYNNAIPFQFRSFISHANRLFESVVFSAPHGTVLNYDENGNPNHEILNEAEKKKVQTQSLVWEGIMDFNDLMKKYFGEDILNIQYNKNSISKIFFQFLLMPEMKDAELLKNTIFENKFSAAGCRYIIEDGLWQTGSLAIKKPSLFKALKPFLRLWIQSKNLLDKIL